MKLSGHLEKWASMVLGAVCLVLLIILAQSSKPVRAGGDGRAKAPARPAQNKRRKAPAPAPAPSEAQNVVDDPLVRLDSLEEIQSRPLVELPRNPFEFEPVRQDPRTVAPAPVAPPPPPPPPPLPIKALGFSDKAGGVKEAYVSDDEQNYVVHTGETFGGRYKVLKITPQLIEIEDATTHQTAQLPFPQ